MEAEVHECDVDALSLSDFDQPRVLCSATPSRLERRQAGDATTRRRQTDLSRSLAVLRLRREYFKSTLTSTELSLRNHNNDDNNTILTTLIQL